MNFPTRLRRILNARERVYRFYCLKVFLSAPFNSLDVFESVCNFLDLSVEATFMLILVFKCSESSSR